ncbi:MAG: lysophospholipid acyltransferase family protein [Acidiferrobacter sp.]
MMKAATLTGTHRAPLTLALFAPRYWSTWAALAALRASLWLPRTMRVALSRRLGDLYYRVNAKRRRIAACNIALCFPALAPSAQQALVRAHFRAAGQGLLHMAVVWWGSPRRLDRDLTVRGLAYYEAARATGRPIIVLHGHCVGLEASLILSRYFPYVGFMKPLKNPLLDWAMTRGRERFGGRVFGREGGLRPLVRALKAGFGVSYVADEDLGPRVSVYAPFFGVPAATVSALGRLAEMTDAIVIPCFTRFDDNGRCTLWMEAPLTDFPTGDRYTDATRMNAVIEQAVRHMPAQYLWTMKRFKTRADGAARYD